MSIFSLTQSEIQPVLAGRKGAGRIPAAHSFPIHTLASDNLYGVLANGVLTVLFHVSHFSAFEASKLAHTLPLGSGIQSYRHFRPEEPAQSYLAVSSPIPYGYPFSPIKGFATLFKSSFVARELSKMEIASQETFEALVRATEGAFPPESVYPLEGFQPLLGILGYPSGAMQPTHQTTAFNMTYLSFPDARLGLLGDCQALPQIPEKPVPVPPDDVEGLICSCVSIPAALEQNRIREEVADAGVFERTILQKKSSDRKARKGEPLPAKVTNDLRYGSIRSYFLLMSPKPAPLCAAAEFYFGALNLAGYPTHTSLVATKDHYCHLFPGNYRLFQDGITFPAPLLDTLIQRFIP